MDNEPAWPALPLEAWRQTRDNLHMWTQVAGKIRLKLAPRVNHWWQVPLYVTPRGLSTSAIPYRSGSFALHFDFIDHALAISASDGRRAGWPLRPCTVADFYRDMMQALRGLGIAVAIWPMPVEVPDPVRFDQDRRHIAYDAEYAHRFWRALLRADAIMKEFRGRFIGKASPVHFFWGSFDLAATRFSGRRAPERPGADAVTREAYSHEVSSCGFWPGSGSLEGPAFYSYAAPEPEGFREAAVPAPAFYSPEFGNWLLRYEDVRAAPDRRERVLAFFQATYEAAATHGKWDRAALERPS